MSDDPPLANPTLTGFRDKVIAAVEAEFPNLGSVDKVRGAMTEEGLRRLYFRTPAVLVAVIGIKDLKKLDTGRFRVTALMSIFIMTEGQERLDLGIQYLEALSLFVEGNQWGVPNTLLPTDIKGEPIYDDRYKDRDARTHHLQENGIFLQGLSWQQQTTIVRTPPGQLGARVEDVGDDRALGRRVDDSKWPETVEVVDETGGLT